MYYTYILKSKKDNNFYTGFTNNLNRRLLEHNTGKVRSTKGRMPFEIVYSESFINKKQAVKREKELKKRQWREIVKSIF